MTAAAHYFPECEIALGNKTIDLASDTLAVGLIASGTFTWGSTPEGYQYVSQFLGGDGTHGALTEVSSTGTGYSRYDLVSPTFTASGEVVTLTCSTNPSWSSATFTAVYGFLYDASVGGSDSAHPIICYWDFGGSQSVSAQTFTLDINASGLVTWTAS
jgi:hypothetical protein